MVPSKYCTSHSIAAAEALLLLTFLLTIPFTLLLIEIFFSYGTLYISDETLKKML